MQILEQPQVFDMYDTPADLLMAHDTDFRERGTKLHGWQLKWMFDFAVETDKHNPFQALGRAANGSGKDKYLIAPCALWLGMKYPRVNSIITSTSGAQLDTQTDPHINYLANSINRDHNHEIWKCNYRDYGSRVTGGKLNLFCTDEPGKAEGHHPFFDGAQMGVFLSEVKSIKEEILEAMSRCNGFTKWCEVSSPGLPNGHFFDLCQDASYVFPLGIPKNPDDRGWRQYHITAFDCPHLSKNYISEMAHRYGEDSHIFKSMVLAEFGIDIDSMVVVQIDKLNRLLKFVPEHIPSEFNTGGFDISAGGDETSLCIRNGNKILAVIAWRYSDTQDTIKRAEYEFRKWKLDSNNSPVWTDAGGLGKPIIDQLRERGWKNVQYVLNQSKPFDDKAYKNLGTNLWFLFARLIEELEIILIKDDLMIKQLANRFYKITELNKFQLESKLQARAHGHPSPDRADSVVLAFYDYSPSYLAGANKSQITIPARNSGPAIAPYSHLQEVQSTSKESIISQYMPSMRKNDGWLEVEISRLNNDLRNQLVKR